MKTAVIFVGLAIAIAGAGCDKADDKHAGATGAANVPADNTKKNERDRDPAAVTPMDQGENAADLAVTQKIRQDVMKDDTLSMTAKNVKIITANGVVTLRGPVKSDKEKADIGAIAQRAEGAKRVDNQLEIEAH